MQHRLHHLTGKETPPKRGKFVRRCSKTLPVTQKPAPAMFTSVFLLEQK
ncbi:hypothetical protein G9C98_004425 [Cotesia typhae]|uniref:Uncharacterized protein n=1 Tax=Cotesia typhae TaxID=2053667 RepID=A0A8J5R2W8_9HYME|nr:hypothetical protein G9C98_004425 [Cotesia typhae]